MKTTPVLPGDDPAWSQRKAELGGERNVQNTYGRNDVETYRTHPDQTTRELQFIRMQDVISSALRLQGHNNAADRINAMECLDRGENYQVRCACGETLTCSNGTNAWVYGLVKQHVLGQAFAHNLNTKLQPIKAGVKVGGCMTAHECCPRCKAVRADFDSLRAFNLHKAKSKTHTSGYSCQWPENMARLVEFLGTGEDVIKSGTDKHLYDFVLRVFGFKQQGKSRGGGYYPAVRGIRKSKVKQALGDRIIYAGSTKCVFEN